MHRGNGNVIVIPAAPTLIMGRKRWKIVRAGCSRGISRACLSSYSLLMVMLVTGTVAVLNLGISEWLGLSDPSIVGDPKYSSSETLRLDDISALRVGDIRL